MGSMSWIFSDIDLSIERINFFFVRFETIRQYKITFIGSGKPTHQNAHLIIQRNKTVTMLANDVLEQGFFKCVTTSEAAAVYIARRFNLNQWSFKMLYRLTLAALFVAATAASYHDDKGVHIYNVRTEVVKKEEHVPIPIEVVKHVPYPVKVHVEQPVPYHVPKPYPVKIEKEVPFPVHVTVPHPYPVYKEVKFPVEVPVENPVPYHVPKPYAVVVEKKVPYPVEKEVPVPVKHFVQVPKPYHVPVTVEKKVPYIVEKSVPVKVEVAIEKPYPVEVPKPYPVTVEKKVPYFVEKKVPYLVKVPQYDKVPVRTEPYSLGHYSQHQLH